MTARVLNPDLDWKEFRDQPESEAYAWRFLSNGAMSTNFLHPAQTLILTHLSPESVEKMWNQTQETLRTNLFLAIVLLFSQPLEIIRSKAFCFVFSWKSETIKWFKSLFGSRVVSADGDGPATPPTGDSLALACHVQLWHQSGEKFDTSVCVS